MRPVSNARLFVLVAAAVMVAVQVNAQGVGAVVQTEDIGAQGASGHGGAVDGAMVVRTRNGLTATVDMPTPVSWRLHLSARRLPQPDPRFRGPSGDVQRLGFRLRQPGSV